MVLIFTPIFSFSATLPSGYTELEYITTNHDAYIQTNLTVNDFDRVTARIRLYDYDGNGQGFGENCPNLFGSSASSSSGGSSSKLLRLYDQSASGILACYNNRWGHSWYTHTPTLPPLNVFTDYDIKLGNGEQYVKVNGTVIQKDNISGETLNNTYPVTMFALNFANSQKSGIPYLDCESFVFYDGFNVVGNFIPAKRDSDNVIGMYDIISHTFFTSTGTAAFMGGAEMVTTAPQEPTDFSEYTQLEYIESTGTQWIDSGIKPTQNTSALYSCAVIGEVSNRDVHLFGSRLSYIDQAFNLCYMNTPGNGLESLKFLSGTNFSQTQTPLITETTIKNKHDYYLSGTRVDVDGTNVLNFTTSNYNGEHNLWLFALNNAETLHSQVVAQRVYGCKIWDNGMLVRDFVPVRRNSDGLLGMYDLVTSMFFTNVGTGRFINGPRIVEIRWGNLAEPDASGMCVYGETFTAPSTAPTAPSGLKFLGWIPR